jgi:hypothetical protein
MSRTSKAPVRSAHPRRVHNAAEGILSGFLYFSTCHVHRFLTGAALVGHEIVRLGLTYCPAWGIRAQPLRRTSSPKPDPHHWLGTRRERAL